MPNPGSMSNSCPSLPKSPESESWFDLLQARSAPAVRRRVKRSHDVEESPRSLGRSGRHRVGARHHNIDTANRCWSCHSTKGASWSPPPRHAPIGSWKAVSHAVACFYWTTGLSINFRAEPPPRAFDEWVDRLHSWTAVIPPTNTHPHAHAHSHTNWGLNEHPLTLFFFFFYTLCKKKRVRVSSNCFFCGSFLKAGTR